MNQNQITIAIDAMGGDDAPSKTLKGVEIFLLKQPNTKIILLGDKSIIEKTIISNKIIINNYEIINTL